MQQRGPKQKVQEIIRPTWVDDCPIPYDESLDPDPFWIKGPHAYCDPADEHMPKSKGFITDMIYTLRGTESPTLFVEWTALSLISSVVKREVSIKWFYNPLYTHLYVILAGTAGIVKKSSVISFGASILDEIDREIRNDVMRAKKQLNIMRDKGTPEALIEALNAGKIRVRDATGEAMRNADGKALFVPATNEILILLSEMSVMVNKQSYNESLIQILMRLYDPEGTFESATKGGGKIKLKKLHTNLLAATTAEGFKDSIPNAALGDGFISRCVIVFQEKTTRRFFPPRIVKSAPDVDELRKRLAWIAENAQGEFSFDEEATAYAWEWYNRFRDNIERDISSAGSKSRMDVILLKVAVLLKIQAYDLASNVVDIRYIKDAGRLLRYTYSLSPMLIQDIRNEGFMKYITKIENYIKAKGEAKRQQTLQNTGVRADDLTAAIEYLYNNNRVSIWRASNGSGKLEEQDYATRAGDEIYKYEVPEWESQEEDQE